jgi:hypothetical protein
MADPCRTLFEPSYSKSAALGVRFLVQVGWQAGLVGPLDTHD